VPKKYMQDAGMVAGCLLLCYGLSLVSRPLGLIVGGLLIAAFSFFSGYEIPRKPR
jgi:hypothetical protein